MTKQLKIQLKKLLTEEKELSLLSQISSVLYWDQDCSMPEAANPFRTDQIIYVSSLAYQKLTSSNYKKFITNLYKNRNKFTGKNLAIVEQRYEEIVYNRKVPISHIKKWEEASLLGRQLWLKARNENNFEIFAPHLQRLIKLQQKEAEYINKEIYEASLYKNDESISVSELKEILFSLGEELRSLLVQLPPPSSKSPLLSNCFYSLIKQKELARDLIALIGVDSSRHVLGETIHPFEMVLSPNDVRIANAYRENDVIFGITSSMHEGAHCLFEQGISSKFNNTCLQSAPSTSLHESQSRFYETIIGQSYDFWSYYYPKLQSFFPEPFSRLSLEEFYQQLNYIQPSLIRLEADEITYCLHIIIRFELELEMLEGDLKAKNLPEAWDKKYEKYLGVKPTTVNNGVLQDVHWCDGFGYFPSYAIGNMLAGMFYQKMKAEGILNGVAKGEFVPIKTWLNKNLHQYGSLYDQETIIQRIFKKPLTHKDYIDYLKEKYLK